MQKINTVLLLFLAAACTLLMTMSRPSRAQKIYDTQITWGARSNLGSCAGVDFYYQLSVMPGVDGKQRVQLTVKNNNTFAVNTNLKARFESSEGDKYESPSSGSGVLNGGRETTPNMLAWLPFDLRAGDNPEVAAMQLFDVEIRNWDKDDSPPSDGRHYTRGTLISQGCKFEKKMVGTKKDAQPQTANGPFPVGCWKFTYDDKRDGDDYSNVIYKVFRADGKNLDLSVDKTGKLYNWAANRFWKLSGSEITISQDYGGGQISDIETLRYDGTRLRGWYSNDKGDVPSNVRYYGVPDGGCGDYENQARQQGAKW